MSWKDQFAATVVIVLWIVLFCACVLIDSRPYRLAINYGPHAEFVYFAPDGYLIEPEAPADPIESEAATVTRTPDYVIRTPVYNVAFMNWFIVLTCYSVPNMLWLCMAAAVAGAIMRRSNRPMQNAAEPPAAPVSYVGAALVGFLIYLAFFAGVITLSSTADFLDPTQDTVLRRAPLLSIIAFMLTYEPRLLAIVLERLSSFVEATVSTKVHDKAMAQPGSKEPTVAGEAEPS